MSEEKKKKDKDYRAMIRARAEITRRLRQRIVEKADRTEKTEARSLREKVELAKEKKKEK